MLRPTDNLPLQIDRAIHEAKASGLRESLRVEGTLPGGQPFIALGFQGLDATGTQVHATRVVTPSAIVLAIGPARVALQEPPRPDELLPSLLPSGAFPSGVDLTGDHAPDISLRSPDGTLAIHRIELQGSAPYPILLRANPTRVLDINEDGFPDLAGTPSAVDNDSIHPEFLDVAVSDRVRFRNDHPAAIAYHQKLARRPTLPQTAPLPDQLRVLMERGFHDACTGTPLPSALQPATALISASQPLPEPIATSWAYWYHWLTQTFPQHP